MRDNLYAVSSLQVERAENGAIVWEPVISEGRSRKTLFKTQEELRHYLLDYHFDRIVKLCREVFKEKSSVQLK